MFQQIFISQQILLSIHFTVKFALLYPFSQTSMVNEVPTVQLPQKGLLFVRTGNALQLLNFYVKFFAFDYIPSYIFTEEAGKGSSQKVSQSPRTFQLRTYIAHLGIHLLLHLPILALPPFLFCSILADERMFDMFSQFEAIIAKSNILAVHTLIDSLICIDFSQFAAIAVIVILLAAHFFGDLLLLDFVFFLFDFSHYLGWLLIPTEWTFYNSIVFDLMLGPLHETFQVEGVATDCGTGGGGIAFYDLGVADRTQIVLLLVFLFDDDIASGDLYFDVFQKIRDFVLMYATIGDNITQFFVIVCMPEEQRIVVWYVKNLSEHVESVETLFVIVAKAGTLEFVADGDLEFGATDIFENEACPPRNARKVKFGHKYQLVFDLFNFEQTILLLRLRHHTINIIRQAIIFYSYSQMQRQMIG